MSDTPIRAFIAIEIPDEVRTALVRVQQRLRKVGAKVSWAPPENIHLTLLFLGDVGAALIPDVERELDRMADTVPPFAMAVDGVGSFGSPKSPRVIWAGVAESTGTLAELQMRLAGAVRALGVPLEDRPFHAHLTLGRVRSSRGAGALTSALSSASVTVHESIRVDRVSLFESRLHPEGARYTILHSATLKGEP